MSVEYLIRSQNDIPAALWYKVLKPALVKCDPHIRRHDGNPCLKLRFATAQPIRHHVSSCKRGNDYIFMQKFTN